MFLQGKISLPLPVIPKGGRLTFLALPLLDQANRN